MKITWRTLLYILLISLISFIVYLFKSFFYINLIDPITQILWMVVRSFLSIDQAVLWIILIVLVSFVGLHFLPSDKHNKTRSSYLYPYKIEDSVTSWKLMVQSAEIDSYARVSLQQNLEALASSINDFYGNAEKYKISTPKPITNPWRLINGKLINLFERVIPKGEDFLDSELKRNLNQILDTMENHMEMQNDQTKNDPKNR
jgi:hypothetical protein